MTSFIDPKATFDRLSENPTFMEPIAEYFKYDMPGLFYSQDPDYYIDQMVVCENASRMCNCDNLINLKMAEYKEVRANNPLHALNMILNGLHLDFNPKHATVVSDSNLTRLMAVMYEMRKTVDFEEEQTTSVEEVHSQSQTPRTCRSCGYVSNNCQRHYYGYIWVS